MNIGNLLFSRRVRQNHALEHATITILSRMVPNLSVSARSSADGFIIFGNVDLGVLRHAMDEALRRLQAGEAELAIHPNCGTNIAVGVSLITLGTLLSLTSNQPRTRIAAAAASSLASLMVARPVGQYLQRHLTTLPDLVGVRVTTITNRKLFGLNFIDVRTVQE